MPEETPRGLRGWRGELVVRMAVGPVRDDGLDQGRGMRLSRRALPTQQPFKGLRGWEWGSS